MTTGSSSATFPGITLQSPRKMAKTNRKASTENMNDLLNFSLPPRQNRQMSSIPRRSRRTGNVHGVWNKERFLNAQYRFVMNPNGDYTVHFADPDIYFQWQDILQIIVPRPVHVDGDSSTSDVAGLTSCPICLSPPTAPRMTKCGHVFCFPCILHYLSTSENKWARCPICFDSVHGSQLKCVKWYEGPAPETDTILEITPSPGTSLRMRLMQRPHMTTLALPRSHTWPSDLLPPHQAPFHFLPDVFSFGKFMLATPQYLIGDLTKELDHLAEEKRAMGLMQDDLSVYFLTGAEEKVRGQIEKAEALDTPLLKERIEKASKDQTELVDKAEARLHRLQMQEAAHAPEQPPATPAAEPLPPHEIPTEFLASRSTPSVAQPNPGAQNPVNSRPEPRNRDRANVPRQRRNVNPPPPDASSYFYYQAASGLPIFLHPLDIKILLTHFKSYSSFPDEITLRVQASSEGTVNADLRKRCKYLSHLPESADVIFVEADLEGVVSEERLKEFEKSLGIREGKRREKARRDDRAKLKAEERDKEQEMEALRRFMPSGRDYVPSVSKAIEPPRGENIGTVVGGVASSLDGAQSNTLPSPAPTGAWGNRSFASALHSSSGPGRNRTTDPARRRDLTEDEWDADEMWQDLEQRTLTGGGGKKKRGAKMVVLGGGGSGARRR
ncbi:alkylbase DNA N-glycosylase [Coprinopsis sp. MPI-PUGE-AT-0042]|nr:alkylbase DNA N-glycosylase [Coprinopsis sp. MPI-PUGE-AT-0042]